MYATSAIAERAKMPCDLDLAGEKSRNPVVELNVRTAIGLIGEKPPDGRCPNERTEVRTRMDCSPLTYSPSKKLAFLNQWSGAIVWPIDSTAHDRRNQRSFRE
jgi:hypothetical protein